MMNVAVVKISFAALAATFFLSACSGGASAGDEASSQQAKDSASLQALYTSVEGVWAGTVTNSLTGMKPFRGELKLYIDFISEGTNPDGRPKQRPVLRGKFQPSDFISETDTVRLTADYDRSGRLVLTEADQRANGREFSLTGAVSGAASGSASGRIMNLRLTRKGGVWGNFEAVRVATTASAPVGGEAIEYRERFLRIIGPLEGRYFGTMKSVNGNDYRVEIALVIIEGPDARLTLAAQYKRLDAPPGDLEWNLAANYDSQTGEIFMRENPSTGGSTVPGGSILSVTGRLETRGGRKVLDVTVRNKSAVLGTLEAIRN